MTARRLAVVAMVGGAVLVGCGSSSRSTPAPGPPAGVTTAPAAAAGYRDPTCLRDGEADYLAFTAVRSDTCPPGTHEVPDAATGQPATADQATAQRQANDQAQAACLAQNSDPNNSNRYRWNAWTDHSGICEIAP